MSAVPWRCSACGMTAEPDPYKPPMDPRYAEGYCPACRRRRQLIRAETVAKATEGYHVLLAAAKERKAARAKLKYEQVKE